jgi:hypothetical protein
VPPPPFPPSEQSANDALNDNALADSPAPLPAAPVPVNAKAAYDQAMSLYSANKTLEAIQFSTQPSATIPTIWKPT